MRIKKALLDTCVIIDLLQKRRPFFEEAHLLLLAAAKNRFEASLSAKSITDIYYLMHHFFHDNKKTRRILEKLFVLFSVLDTTEADCKKALVSPINDYEDAIMVETAKRLGMDCIITRNVKDYSESKIPIYSPGDFLQMINE